MADESNTPAVSEKPKAFGTSKSEAQEITKSSAPTQEKAKEPSLDDLANSLAGIIKTLKPKVRDNTVRLSKAVHTMEFSLQYLKDHIKNMSK